MDISRTSRNLGKPAENVLDRIDNISRPSNDKRLYRALTLKNRMKVILISDPWTEESAASMAIGVGKINNLFYLCDWARFSHPCFFIIGSLNDPSDVPGVANLVAYTLVIGRKKYPEPYGFKKFVEARGGPKP